MRQILLLTAMLSLLAPSAQAVGSVTYTLARSTSPTADELDAYQRITVAMDSALFYYNKYTTIRKALNIQYNTGVATADGNSNGTIRFGANRAYMVVSTAMHEISHTIGVGTSSQYASLMVGGIFTGPKATAALREITADSTAQLKGDAQHIWPYGINFSSEVKSTADLVAHCRIIDALYQDLYQESLTFVGRVVARGTSQCMARNGTALGLGTCSDSTSLVRIIAMGDINPVYRMEFGDRVLDVPNQSVATGIALGTYTWNGGANQKFTMEPQTQFTGDVVRIHMVQSMLYLRSSGSTVIQDASTANLNSQYWELVDTTNSTVALRLGTTVPSAVSTEFRKALHKFDMLGRRGSYLSAQ